MYKSDLKRIREYSHKNLIRELIKNPNYRVVFLFRKSKKSFFYNLLFKIYSKRQFIEIDKETVIGKGLFINHLGGVIINKRAVLGDNINLEPRVVIGQQNRGERIGAPVIKNKVWIGANSVIVGSVTIGNNVLIAPNSYINFDVPDNSIVIGNPGRIISSKNATKNYVTKIV